MGDLDNEELTATRKLSGAIPIKKVIKRVKTCIQYGYNIDPVDVQILINELERTNENNNTASNSTKKE